MGFFGDIGDTLFGDQGEGAAESQSAQNLADREFIAQQAALARADVAPLFQQAQGARFAGSQGALDVLGGSLPSQLDVFQGGNFAAQNALLGGNFTPQTLATNLDFIPTQLPQSIQPVDIQALLAGSQQAGQVSDLERRIRDQQLIFDRTTLAGGKRNRKAAAGATASLAGLQNQLFNLQGAV